MSLDLLSYNKLAGLTLEQRSVLFVYNFRNEDKNKINSILKTPEGYKSIQEFLDQSKTSDLYLLSGNYDEFIKLKQNGFTPALLIFCYHPKFYWIKKFLEDYFSRINVSSDIEAVKKEFQLYMDDKAKKDQLNIQWNFILQLSGQTNMKEHFTLSENAQWFLIQENLLKAHFVGISHLPEEGQQLLNYILGLKFDLSKNPYWDRPGRRFSQKLIAELLNNSQLVNLLEKDLKLYNFALKLFRKQLGQLQEYCKEDVALQNREKNLYPEELIQQKLNFYQKEKSGLLRKNIFKWFPPGSFRGDMLQKTYLKIKPFLVRTKNELIDPEKENNFEISDFTNFQPISLDIILLPDKKINREKLLSWEKTFSEIFPDNCNLWIVGRDLDKYKENLPESAQIWDTENDGSFDQFLNKLSAEYVCFLKPDEIVKKTFYSQFIKAIQDNQNTALDVLIFDIIRYEAGNKEKKYFFKPETFSSAMLLSIDYFYPAIYNRLSLQKIPELNELDFPRDISSAWELSLAISRLINIEVKHLPYVLCEVSEFRNAANNLNISSHILKTHLHKLGLKNVEVLIEENGDYQFKWDYHPGKVSIIIPTRNKLFYLFRLLNYILFNSTYKNIEIILIDNGSWLRVLAEKIPVINKIYKQYSNNHNIKIISYDETFNYSRANNVGAEVASGLYYLFMNNDMLPLHSNWIEELILWASLPNTGVVTGKLLYPNKKIQAFGTVVGMHGHAGHVFQGMPENSETVYGSTTWYRSASAVTGACMMMKHSLFRRIGGFNEEYKLAFSDVEFCLQARALGFENICTPFSRIIHYEGMSRSKYIPYKDLYIGLRRLAPELIKGDEYFPKTLSLLNTAPSFKIEGEPDPINTILKRMTYIPEE